MKRPSEWEKTTVCISCGKDTYIDKDTVSHYCPDCKYRNFIGLIDKDSSIDYMADYMERYVNATTIEGKKAIEEEYKQNKHKYQ